MKRGTDEFYEMQKSFEKAVSTGILGYMSSDLTKDNFNSTTFYANGQVNAAFLAFMAGYATAKCVYS